MSLLGGHRQAELDAEAAAADAAEMAALGFNPSELAITEEELDVPLVTVLARTALSAIRSAMARRPPAIPFNVDVDARLEDNKRWWEVSPSSPCFPSV